MYDDLLLLRDNPSLHSWAFLWEGFASPMWEMVEDARAHAGGFYRPIGTAAFLLLHKLGGGSAWAFHAASWLLYAVCALLISKVARGFGWKESTATVAGLFFALHGAHAEPVAWASSLTYLLALAFSLQALRLFLAQRFWLSSALLLLAMLTQESSIGMWLLALGMGLFHASTSKKSAALVPLVVGGLCLWLLRVQAFDAWSAGFAERLTWFGLELREHPFLEEAALSFSLITEYLQFLCVPWPHAPFHPLRLDIGIGDAERIVPALIGVFVSLCALGSWLRFGKKPLIGWGVGMVFAGLAPVLRTSGLGQFPFEERFAFFASAGFALLVAGIWQSTTSRFPRHRNLLVPLLAAVLVGNGYSLHRTLPHWGTEQALFDWARKASPHAMMSWTELGRVHLERAQREEPQSGKRIVHAAAAEQAFQSGLAISPDEWFVSAIDRHNGNIGLANAVMVSGDIPTAESAFRKILTRWPESPEAHAGLGFCLVTLAEHEMSLGMLTEATERLEEAAVLFAMAMESSPHYTEVVYGRGHALSMLGKSSIAIPFLKEAFERDPSDARFAVGLALSYFEIGRHHFAEQTWNTHRNHAPTAPQFSEILRSVGIER